MPACCLSDDQQPALTVLFLEQGLASGNAHPANVRVTRQAAARQRALQQQLQQFQQLPEDPMSVEDRPATSLESDTRDPLTVPHYVRDIFAYLRKLELAHRVSPHFMQV